MKENQSNPKVVSILLWVTVLFNMLFADIFSLNVELIKGNIIDIPMDVTVAMGIAAVITNIPILMVLLSWILPYKANRWTNMAAASFTILFVIGGGVLLPHYLIMGSIEVVLLLAVIVINFRWKPFVQIGS